MRSLNQGGSLRRAPETGTPNASAAGVYDRRLNVYNLKPYHLRKTRAALGASTAALSPCRIAFAGDSTTQGVGSGAGNALCWPTQFGNFMSSRGYNTDGPGLINPYVNNSSVWPQWAFSPALGASNGFAQFGSGLGLGWIIATSTSSTATFTSTNAGTVADIYYLNTGGAFTYSIDGAAAVTVTPTGAQTVGKATVTGLSNATHAILITSTSTNAQIMGAMVRASATKGLTFYNSGLGGSTTASWLQSGAWYAQASLVASGFQPHLTFLKLGINDLNTGVTTATYKANMQSIITILKAQGDVVLVTPNPGASLDLTAYLQALYELADSNDLPLIDLVDRWKDQPTMLANSAYFDTLHPNGTGYADEARAALVALGL